MIVFLVGLAIAMVFFILESVHYLMKKMTKKNISRKNSAFFPTGQKQASEYGITKKAQYGFSQNDT